MSDENDASELPSTIPNGAEMDAATSEPSAPTIDSDSPKKPKEKKAEGPAAKKPNFLVRLNNWGTSTLDKCLNQRSLASIILFTALAIVPVVLAKTPLFLKELPFFLKELPSILRIALHPKILAVGLIHPFVQQHTLNPNNPVRDEKPSIWTRIGINVLYPLRVLWVIANLTTKVREQEAAQNERLPRLKPIPKPIPTPADPNVSDVYTRIERSRKERLYEEVVQTNTRSENVTLAITQIMPNRHNWVRALDQLFGGNWSGDEKKTLPQRWQRFRNALAPEREPPKTVQASIPPDNANSKASSSLAGGTHDDGAHTQHEIAQQLKSASPQEAKKNNGTKRVGFHTAPERIEYSHDNTAAEKTAHAPSNSHPSSHHHSEEFWSEAETSVAAHCKNTSAAIGIPTDGETRPRLHS